MPTPDSSPLLHVFHASLQPPPLWYCYYWFRLHFFSPMVLRALQFSALKSRLYAKVRFWNLCCICWYTFHMLLDISYIRILFNGSDSMAYCRMSHCSVLGIWQDMQGGGHGKTYVGFRDEWQNHKNLNQISRRSSRKTNCPLQRATALNRQHFVISSAHKLRDSSLTGSLWTMGVTWLLTDRLNSI